jgi:peptide/nickel transport system substrate-binding protein
MGARNRRVGGVLLVAAFVAAACQAAPITGSSPSPSAAAAKIKDTIVVGMSQEPDTLFAPISSMYVATIVQQFIAKGLTERDNQNVYQPRIAETTPTLENGGAKLTKTADGKDQLTVTYKVRDGVKFSNGDPVTSADFKYSWDLIVDKTNGLPVVSRVAAEKYQAVNTPDAKTVEVVYKPGELDPLYFSFCCTLTSKKAVDAVGGPAKIKDSALTRQPVTAGPYAVKEWAPGSSITLEARDDFWLGKPKTKTIIVKFVPDTNTMLAQVRAGQVDIVTEDALALDQTPELDKLEAETNSKAIYTSSATWEHIDFNLRDPKAAAAANAAPHPILGDKRVRQAIAYGVNRESITKQVLYGKTKPLHSMYFPPSWAAAADSDITVYNFDQAKAKALLDEAGWVPGPDGVRQKGGQKLELKLGSTSGNKMREQTTQVMANDLKAIGIKINIELIVSTKWFATRGEGPLSSGTFDLGLYAWVGGDDPLSFLYYCDEIPTKENNFQGQNYPGYCNRDLTNVMKDANNKLQQADRKPLYVQAQKLWTADLPVLPLYQRLNQTIAPKSIKNFKPAPTNTAPSWNAFEWELPAP